MSKAIIVSGFPCVGKSYLTEHNNGLNIIDSDSSKFSWLEKGIRNPDFPNNYIEHIKSNLKTCDIILVSSHKEVREALIKNKLDFILAYPHIDCLNAWVDRCEKRGSPDSFIELIKSNWYSWIEELEEFAFDNDLATIVLDEKEYLSDNIRFIMWQKNINKYHRALAKEIERVIDKLIFEYNIEVDNQQEFKDYSYDAIAEYCGTRIII